MGGSYESIQSDLWHNLEGLGISPADLSFAAKAKPGTKVFDFIHGKEGVADSASKLKHNRWGAGRVTFSGNPNLAFNHNGGGWRAIEFRTRRTALSDENIFFRSETAGWTFRYYQGFPRKITFNLQDWGSSAQLSTAEPPLNKDEHYVLLHKVSDDTFYMYVNGKLVSSAVRNRVYYSSNGIVIDNSIYNFSDLKFYSVELPENTIAKLSRTDLWKPRPDISYFDAAAQSGILPISITTGAPVLGSPGIGQTHQLIAAGIVVAAPAPGTPALSPGTHQLTATPIETAPPAPGSPRLDWVQPQVPEERVFMVGYEDRTFSVND